MQTEFRAIVQSEYGAPEKVLRIAKRQLNSEELGADDVLVKVMTSACTQCQTTSSASNPRSARCLTLISGRHPREHAKCSHPK
jgi:hypothetical protein